MAEAYTAEHPDQLDALPVGTKELQIRLLMPFQELSIVESSHLPDHLQDPLPGHVKFLSLSNVGKSWREQIALVPVPTLSEIERVSFSAALPVLPQHIDAEVLQFDTAEKWADGDASEHVHLVRWDDFEKLVVLLATQMKMKSRGPLHFSVEADLGEVVRGDLLDSLTRGLEALSRYKRQASLGSGQATGAAA